jgi:hypothetical protein
MVLLAFPTFFLGVFPPGGVAVLFLLGVFCFFCCWVAKRWAFSRSFATVMKEEEEKT